MTSARILRIAGTALLLSGCADLGAGAHEPGTHPVPATAKDSGQARSYLDLLSGMAPDDMPRRQATLETAFATSQRYPTPENRLRYALALGSAGAPNSNPVEARRLLTELIAAPDGLQPAERTLAEAFLREFDARVTLYAELARQREEANATLAATDANAERRVEALASDNARLRRALNEANRKLEAVAEMERQLLERASEPESPPPEPR